MAFLLFAASAVAVAFVVSIPFMKRKRAPVIRSLAYKHVFITGASSGIGLAIAKKALLEGAYVTLSARNSLKLNKAVDTLLKEVQCERNRIKVAVADVGDNNAIATAVKEAHSWRPIDVLVCNAGYTRAGYFDKVDVEVHEGQVQTNFMGAIYTVHSALPLMKSHSSEENKLSIVIVSSGAGLYLLYGSAVYSATKHALRGLAEALYLELLPYNINVNLICPGFVDTALLDDVDKDGEFDVMLKKLNLYDRKRVQTPETIAESTLAAVKKGSFLVAPNPLFFPLVVMTRGMLAPSSFTKTLVEAFWAPIIRILTYKSTKDTKKLILEHHNKRSLEAAG